LSTTPNQQRSIHHQQPTTLNIQPTTPPAAKYYRATAGLFQGVPLKLAGPAIAPQFFSFSTAHQQCLQSCTGRHVLHDEIIRATWMVKM